MKLLKYAAFVLLSLIYACETNPPTDPAGNIVTQKVVITSNIDSAKIFIDDIFTNLYTPDSINLAVGSYVISLEKDNYTASPQTITVTETAPLTVNIDMSIVTIQKVVLLEDFANTSCAPCVVSNQYIEELKGEFGDQLLSVKFPTNFPGPNDPFYLAASSNCDFRRSFYNVLFAPTVILDGTVKPVPTDKDDIKTNIEQQLTIAAPFEIHVAGDVVGSNYKTNIQLEIPDISGVDYSNSVLYAAIVETEIQYSAPNGESEFYDVMRAVLPSNNGESLGNISQSGIYTFNFEQAVDGAWDTSKLKVVAFVQNSSTKQIYQAGSNH
ncbi:MAG: hypothetical protein SCALA702_24180 [Melioribacteraceae bacterium]|nr:MAG: hypothetical protein SCALA702_24180 [Melioribacteraceae bacterium]